MKLWEGLEAEVMNDIYAQELHVLLKSRRMPRVPSECSE